MVAGFASVAGRAAAADALAGLAAATLPCCAPGIVVLSKVTKSKLAASIPKVLMPDYARRIAFARIRYKSERSH